MFDLKNKFCRSCGQWVPAEKLIGSKQRLKDPHRKTHMVYRCVDCTAQREAMLKTGNYIRNDR